MGFESGSDPVSRRKVLQAVGAATAVAGLANVAQASESEAMPAPEDKS